MIEYRNKILNSYQMAIEDSLRENRSQIKLINFGTGLGKTYALFRAIYETIRTHRTHPTIQIIGIYVAPLREHLKVPSEELENQYKDIPVYQIYSFAQLKETEALLPLYKKWISSIQKNDDFGKIFLKKCSRECINDGKQYLEKAQFIIEAIEKLTGMRDDEEFKKYIENKKQELHNWLEKFLDFVIKNEPDESRWSVECSKLCEIIYPLYLLREKSGIIMLTYDKFETTVPCFKFNRERWIKKDLTPDKYVAEQTNDSRKFIIAFDEQEDGYRKMLAKMIKIITPESLAINNALSSIHREFSVLFSKYGDENKKLFEFLAENPNGFDEFEEYLNTNKTVNLKIMMLAPIYQRLSEEGNSQNFFKEVIKIIRGFEQALKEIAKIFDTLNEKQHVAFDFDMLKRVISKFENNRSLLISRELYETVRSNLLKIFTFNDLYIYDIEPLKKLFLSNCPSGHVTITEQANLKNPSLAELIYAMFAVGRQIKTIKNTLAAPLNAKDSQSHSLNIWAEQVEKAAKEEFSPQQQIMLLNQEYVYERYKSIINIKEIPRYQNQTNTLINPEFKEVSIGNTAISASPENKILTMMKPNGNTLFLISATGGIHGDLSTSYDLRYLEGELFDETSQQSSLQKMTAEEISLCQQIRKTRQSTRQPISVEFFHHDLQSYPNKETQGIATRFEKNVLEAFIASLKNKKGERFYLNRYKKQELQGFCRFLFYLFENNSIHEIFALTQKLTWIKELLSYCESLKNDTYTLKRSEEHPNMYFLQIKQFPVTIKLILYEASFNKNYKKDNKNINKKQRTYQDELKDKDGEKIFFISAYPSASKGFNPIINPDKKDKEKDFDCLVLLMDPYFTLAQGKKEEEDEKNVDKTEICRQFALMKSLVAANQIIEIKEFGKYLSSKEASDFKQQQHQILLGKAILQSIGRIERKDFPNQAVKIFINEETRQNLAQFYKYLEKKEPEEIRKLSVNNYAVYERVQEEEKNRCIPHDAYDEHLEREIEASRQFKEYREDVILEEIEKFHQGQNTIDIITQWETLRDPLAFNDPQAYKEKLKKTTLFPDEFIESLFYENNDYVFTPYETRIDGFDILTDSRHGKQPYSYQQRLYPEYLKHGDSEEREIFSSLYPLTESIYRLYRILIPQPEIFDSFIPRPHFFRDVFYPAFTEHFVKYWIEDVIFSGKDWETIKKFHNVERLVNFMQYKTLYEKFDLYYIVNHKELRCIDVKAWSQASDNNLSPKILKKTKDKLRAIAQEHSEFNTVKGLLLNLHAEQQKNEQYSLRSSRLSLFSGNLIFFDEQHFPVASNILRNFLIKGAI